MTKLDLSKVTRTVKLEEGNEEASRKIDSGSEFTNSDNEFDENEDGAVRRVTALEMKVELWKDVLIIFKERVVRNS